MSEVIAIDGPAASGKSSVSRELARRLGFAHVNSGLMYRAATRAVIDAGIDPDDDGAVAGFIDEASIEIKKTSSDDEEAVTVWVRGKACLELAAPEINAHVSAVSRVERVREVLVELQREMASDQPTVMEGRDIGSVVFPSTPYKFYIDASEEVRAKRRAAQGLNDSVAARDRADSTRRSSPLKVAEDAVVIDSSDMTIDEVVERVIRHLDEAGLAVG